MRRNHPNSTGNKDNSEEEEEQQFHRNNNKMWKGRKKKTTNICSSLHHSCHSRYLTSSQFTPRKSNLHTYIHTYIISYTIRSPPVFSLFSKCTCRMEYYYRYRPANQPASSVHSYPVLPFHFISFHSISFNSSPHTQKMLSIRNNYCGTQRIQITIPTPNHKQDLPRNFRLYDSTHIKNRFPLFPKINKYIIITSATYIIFKEYLDPELTYCCSSSCNCNNVCW